MKQINPFFLKLKWGLILVFCFFVQKSFAIGVLGGFLQSRGNGSITQQAYLKPSTVWSHHDHKNIFGTVVSICGETMVVGAPGNDSESLTINGTENGAGAEESGAVYVFVRSAGTWSQQAFIKPSNGGAGDAFGGTVDIDGDLLVVGAVGEDSSTTGVNSTGNNSASAAGAAYVFSRTGTTWTQQAYLKTSNAGTGDSFGRDVAVSGTTVAVGASGESSSATGIDGNQADNTANSSGAVYVFVNSGSWAQQAYIKASNTNSGDLFGFSIDLSGETLAVGAYGEDSNATGVGGTQSDNSASNSGAVYVFTRSGSTWSQQAYLKASNTGGNDYFGYRLTVDNNTLAVGAYLEDSNATGIDGDQANNTSSASGAVYVFFRTGSAWAQQAYIKASNTGTSDYFGFSLCLKSDILVVGSPYEDSNATGINGNQLDNSTPASGAAYVFTRSGTTWSQQAYLKASNTGSNDQFGFAVGIEGDTIVVGARYEASIATGVGGDQTDNTSADAGAVYVMTRSAGTWSQQAYVKASLNFFGGNGIGYQEFAQGVAIDGDTIAVTSPYDDSASSGVNGSLTSSERQNSGAVFVFVRSSGVWTQQAYIKASNPEDQDLFGYQTVALDNETLAVGAPYEDSNATGVGGSQISNSSEDSGAVYVFTRSAGTWSQQAYVKASNTGVDDAFGRFLTLSGDTLGVGVPYEDSNATGIGGLETDNSAIGAGAVYVFFRTTGTWAQQAYIKSSNTESNDVFGYSLDVSGDTLAVGAYAEDSNATGIGGNQADNSLESSGAVYVLTRSGSTWSQQAYIKASHIDASDWFGQDLSLDLDRLAVGAYGEDSRSTIFEEPNPSDNSRSSSGAVFVFDRSGSVWSQSAYIKAPVVDASDAFGASVGLSGDHLVACATGEDSRATSPRGNLRDSGATSSGACYLYKLSGGKWKYQNFIKPHNTGASDQFGTSVAIDGSTIVVGADGEDSNSTGINSTSNDSSFSVGAAYVFTFN